MSDFWDVIVWMFWFAILVAWISLFIHILIDIFRDQELNGGAKALWCLLLIFLPFLGALIYLIARGDSMNQRSMAAAQQTESAYRSYIQDAAGTSSVADELQKLGALRDAGTITTADYESAKAKILA
jgi:Phospholipase_D-nuclease N-terminal/Short C-terminal domain